MAQRRLSRSPFVYMMSNRSHRLYVGATTDLAGRVDQHRHGTYPNAFTARYKFYRLVYYEPAPTYAEALKREKQIKAWRRRWNDLSRDFEDAFLLK